MAQQIGKCTNYSGCKLAYRNEQISVVTKEFRCPECGSPLEPVGGGKKSSSWIVLVTIGIVAVLLLAIGAIIWTLMLPRTPRITQVQELSPTPAATATLSSTPVSTPVVLATPVPTPTAFPTLEEKPPSSEAPGTINLDISLPEIDQVKRAVLKRIDLMPNLTKQNRDRLYSAVDKAHGLGRLFSVSFVTSNIRPTGQDVAFMKSQIEKPQVKHLLDDPTLVLVLLGYADKQGDEKRNLDISTGRAQEVSASLKQLGVQNVIHAVPMGGTDILDVQELSKNRVVEVWAVQP